MTPQSDFGRGGGARAHMQHQTPGYQENGVDLKTLLSRLNNDATQLVHDELELARVELREVAGTFSDELQAAGQTLVKDLAKVGIALSLALLAGFALTAGAILGVGRLLGGAFWAGGLIVGLVLLVAAVVFSMSAARDVRDSESLRLERTRRTARHDTRVMKDEAQRTQQFARDEAAEFKREATRDYDPGSH